MKILLTKPCNVLSFYTSSQNSNLLYIEVDFLSNVVNLSHLNLKKKPEKQSQKENSEFVKTCDEHIPGVGKFFFGQSSVTYITALTLLTIVFIMIPGLG